MDGYYDWVKEHIEEVLLVSGKIVMFINCIRRPFPSVLLIQGAPLNESDHCGDPPLLLAAGNGMQSVPCRVSSCPRLLSVKALRAVHRLTARSQCCQTPDLLVARYAR